MKSKLLSLLILISTAGISQNLNLVGHLWYNVSCAGVWHYVDSLSNEYALVGASDRISIADVTNPAAPAEVFSVPAAPGQSSLWRELKTYGKYAYAVSEGGGGVIVIDLSYLPDTVYYHHWEGDSIISGQLNSAHTIAATDGYLYIFGSNISVGGCIIADISDPWNPHFTGQYSTNYVHDGYVRNDTLWAGEIYAGQFSIIDVSDKYNPVLLQTQQTPAQFCHNVWLSDNSQYAYTTDEVGGAPLGAYDVSDIANIQLINTYYTDSLPNEEVHNVRVLNDFLINPSYGSQITIVDAARPGNLVEIAHAPTDFGSGSSFLCWDASPYLPSGNIIATDVSGGLFVFQPDYIRACYLEGTVTDSISGNPLNGTFVEILNSTKATSSDVSGGYKTGIPVAGVYDIRFSKPGYISKIDSGIVLSNGVLTQLDAQLVPFVISGQVTDLLSGLPLSGMQVSASNGSAVANTTTDSAGNFILTNLNFGVYTISAGGWGYVTECITQLFDGSTPVSLQLSQGYMDDFSIDNGWQVNSTATTGIWERGIPVGTFFGTDQANPGTDVIDDCSDLCYITGNGGGTSSTDDVDNGITVLSSPVFDLTSYVEPYINYSRWFYINPTVQPNFSDSMFIYINNGLSDVLLETITLGTAGNGTWVNSAFKVSDFITPTASMILTVETSDKPGTGNVVEGGFDNFIISEGTLSVAEAGKMEHLKAFPNPFSGTLHLSLDPSCLKSSSSIRVTDLSGRTVSVSKWKNEINLDALPSGLYIIQIDNAAVPVSPLRIVKN